MLGQHDLNKKIMRNQVQHQQQIKRNTSNDVILVYLLLTLSKFLLLRQSKNTCSKLRIKTLGKGYTKVTPGLVESVFCVQFYYDNLI